MLMLFLILGCSLISYLSYKLEERFFSKSLKEEKKYIMDFYDWYKKLCSYTIDSKNVKSIAYFIANYWDGIRDEINNVICTYETETIRRIKFYKFMRYWAVFMKKNYQEENNQIIEELEEILHEIHLYKWKNSIE